MAFTEHGGRRPPAGVVSLEPVNPPPVIPHVTQVHALVEDVVKSGAGAPQGGFDRPVDGTRLLLQMQIGRIDVHPPGDEIGVRRLGMVDPDQIREEEVTRPAQLNRIAPLSLSHFLFHRHGPA